MNQSYSRLLLGGLLLATCAWAGAQTLNPTADAYVQGGSNANKNYGNATTLQVQTNATAAKNFDSYLKFDLGAVPAFSQAKLRLYAALSGSGSLSTTVYAVANTAWGETTINWNNKLALGAGLASKSVVNKTFAWYEFDVTSYLQSERAAGRNLVSLALHAPSASSLLIKANSRQAKTNKPQLVFTPAPPNVAPSVSLTAPANGASYIAPASITLTANAADADGTIQKVEFFQGGSTLIATLSAAPYTYTWSGVATGSYTLTARATDNAGATTTSAAVNISVAPNGAPTVSLTSPANGATYSAPASITLSASAADADGSIQKVEFFRDGSTLIATVTATPYTYTWSNVTAGSYALSAKATDNLGASSTSTAVNITVSAPQQALYYIHPDHLNTPRLITNQAQQVVWRWDNDDPFGANMASENPNGLGTFTFNLRFPGQYFDRETGLHYNYYRDYDPQTGRYIQADPIGLDGGINLYAYVRGTPVSLTDPRGLFFGEESLYAVVRATATGVGVGVAQVVGAAAVLVCTPGNVGQSEAACADDPQKKRKECKEKDDSEDCQKATPWQLKAAGVGNEHDFKTEWGAVPNSRFDICACKDGSVVIKAVGHCGRPGPSIPTDRRWR